MRFLFLLFFLDSLSCNLAVNTFEFVENDLEPISELSYAVLANKPSIKLPEHFILCSSHFQSQIDTKNTHTIYVLYQDENMTIPWFNIGFYANNQLWVGTGQDIWHNLGKLESQDLFEWIHICLEIDLVNETMSASINGKKFGVTDVLGISPSVDIAFNIRLGIVHLSESMLQFHGKITNIQLLLPTTDDIANLTKSLCIHRAEKSILSWFDMKWKLSGSELKELKKDSSLICPTSPYADLTIPLKWTKSRAVDMCSKLGNGKISFLTSRSKEDNDCVRYWSPYRYSVMEGIVWNENENTELEEKLLWGPGYPANITDRSNIVFEPKKGYFQNIFATVESLEECLICNTSLKTEYTLRGNCEYSFLGNFKYKANNINKRLEFAGKRVTIW